jgi:hypothetical protein
MRQELATIHALEYPITKGRDGVESAAWPVLHCHPHARGPFMEFDDKEKKRWEKLQRADTEKEREQERKARKKQEEMKRKAQAQRKAGDLRRSVSMNNLHRRASLPDSACQRLVDLDGDASGCDGATDSANASGYLASGTGGYMAASGNSVGITSTTGTTSTAGALFRNLKLPAALQERIQSQVVTSRKFPSAGTGAGAAGDKEREQEKADQGKKGTMGPPVGIPERPNGLLRKSRSTNTLRLPKREEGCKPGYCESCRAKFEDFKSVRHIASLSHLHALIFTLFHVCCSTSEDENTVNLHRTTRTSFSLIFFSDAFDVRQSKKSKMRRWDGRRDVNVRVVIRARTMMQMTDSSCSPHKTWMRPCVSGIMGMRLRMVSLSVIFFSMICETRIHCII